MNVAVRRIKSPLPLRIVVGASTKDTFTIRPVESMTHNFSDFRGSVGGALKQAFAPNFSSVDLAETETGRGVELIVTRAEMQPTTTIKYGIVLMWDGKELEDVTGESKGKIVAMRGSSSELHEKYDAMLEELVDYTLASFAEQSYDALMRSEKLEKAGVYERLQQPESAAVSPPRVE